MSYFLTDLFKKFSSFFSKYQRRSLSKVIPFFWHLGRWQTVGVMLLVAVGVLTGNSSNVGTAVTGCFSQCGQMHQEDDGRALTILSFNMLHDFPDYKWLEARTAWLSQEINRRQIDIVLLQEVANVRGIGHIGEQLATLTHMNHAYIRANGNRRLIGFEEGLVILSRYPLHDLTFVELTPSTSLFEHRVALHGKINTPQGEIALFVTHLTNSGDGKNGVQVARLQNFVEETGGETAVIVGDFNALPHSPQIQLVSKNWVDTFAHQHPTQDGFTCCLDKLHAPANTFTQRVDYIFLAPNQRSNEIKSVSLLFEPRTHPAGNFYLSDHLGLLLTLGHP